MGFHFDRKVANFLVMKVGVFFSALATAEKILCLHGGGGNANSMRSLMSEIAADLSEFEFVYATAPEGGLWMRDPPSKDQPTTDPNWADAALNYLDNLVENQGPFYALAGYSQGSAFIPIYLAHRGGGGTNGGGTGSSSTTQGPSGSTTKPGGDNDGSCGGGDKDYPCSSSSDCFDFPCVNGCCNFDDDGGDDNGGGATCAHDYPCSSSSDCFDFPCSNGCCVFDDKGRSTGSVFNRVLLMNGYLPTTHQGLMGILNQAAPLTTPAFVFSGGQDPFGPMAPAQAAKFSNVEHRESANVGHHPPGRNDPNYQRILDFMRAGLGGSTTTQGTGGTSATSGDTTTKTTGDTTTKTTGDTTTKTTKETTKDTTTKETTTKTTMETTTKFDPSANCGEPGTMVDWKGAKNSRILYRSMTGVLMRDNFFNFKRMDGRHSSYTAAFDRHTVGDKDLPGGVKKDQMYLTVEGLDTVDFGNKVVDDCLQAVQCGTMAYGNRQDSMAACAAYDKDLGW